ncbi:hypothetical protein EU642_22010 [Salmonella enterica]|nr:hypothetical protein [Salmonella enterica]EAO0118529.1 hypothetical protein [Salmonella enterica]EAO3601633.1 hypothetical protein [Salmonella enterica]EAR6391527.1 hypothetical protein [Salmonella enterica]EAV1285291.1 hypothetical protein [Salmonella enterica]
MPKVIYTLALGPDRQLDNMTWEPLEEGGFISPELSEDAANRYLTFSGFRAEEIDIVLPVTKPTPEAAPAPASEPVRAPVKKAPAKKPAAKAAKGE